jgi:hypothetical protein
MLRQLPPAPLMMPAQGFQGVESKEGCPLQQQTLPKPAAEPGGSQSPFSAQCLQQGSSQRALMTRWRQHLRSPPLR